VWPASALLASSVVTGRGMPPDRARRVTGEKNPDATKIVSSVAHCGVPPAAAPPASDGASNRGWGVPPGSWTLCTFPLARKPSQEPSGEKNGPIPPSVPAIATLSKSSTERR